MKSRGIAITIARVCGLLALAAGSARAFGLVAIPLPLHMSLGSLLAVSLLFLAWKAQKAGEPLLLVIVAAAWAIALPVWGSVQTHVTLPAPWLSGAIHVVCGLGAIGLAEMLGMRLTKKAKAG
ncbi:MAG: hypothetical protein ACOYM2_15575 [Rectinemataceae bacterium]